MLFTVVPFLVTPVLAPMIRQPLDEARPSLIGKPVLGGSQGGVLKFAGDNHKLMWLGMLRLREAVACEPEYVLA